MSASRRIDEVDGEDLRDDENWPADDALPFGGTT
jgi:hypothetical protein